MALDGDKQDNSPSGSSEPQKSSRSPYLLENDSWTHAVARVLIRPLVGTGIKPNHITTLRLLAGLCACGFLALGTRSGNIGGGALWVLSAFLDRADGELARIGNMQSRRGHLYDYYSDVLVNSLFFLAVGFGQRHSFLGPWSLPLGTITCLAMILCCWMAELYETLSGPGVRTFNGGFGFHLDDALYLLGPFAWFGWLAPILAAASVGTSLMAVVILMRIVGLRLAIRARTRPTAKAPA